MAQQIFDQYAPLAKVSANETIPVVAAIAQTRDGKDELLHGTVPFVPAGGLYVPVSAVNRLPVEATLSGRTAVLTTLVSAQAITDTEIRNVTFDASPYRQIDFIVRNSLDSEVAIGFRILDTTWFYIIDDDGTPRPYMPNPAQPEYRWHRVPTRSATGTSRYFMLSQIPLNDGKFKAPFRDYRFTADILYRAVNTPTAGSLSIILVGVPN